MAVHGGGRSTAFPMPRVNDDTSLGYLVAEHGRLLCEGMLSRGAQTEDVWRTVHRAFGMAGYELSGEMESEERQELLALARTRTPVMAPPAVRPKELALMLAVHGKL